MPLFKSNRAARCNTHKWLYPLAIGVGQVNRRVMGFKIHRTIHFGMIPHYKRMERERARERADDKSIRKPFKKGRVQIKIKKEIIKIALLKMGLRKECDLYGTTAHQIKCLAQFCEPFKHYTCMSPPVKAISASLLFR